jgi:intein-encoded DNA endonuclease-like protein
MRKRAKITDQIKTAVLEKRKLGFSYSRIVKEVGISQSSVIRIIKEGIAEDLPIQAKVKKLCPNPRLIIIYFNDVKEDDAKCVVRPGINYQIGKTLKVKKVETSEEPLYRLA